jgi:peptide/nickel transport system ATP-binding protein
VTEARSDATANRAGGSGPVIELRDVGVTYSGRSGLRSSGPAAHAVDGVNLAVNRGEVVALVGESGCGKSTLARAVMGLVPPTRGQVLYDGVPVARKGKGLRAYRQQVQLVLQDPTGALNPRQSVYESVVEGLRIHRIKGDEEQLVASALARCGMRPPERFFLRYPHELSGGQRQRVVVAGALVLDPTVLVADEPVSSLDASVRGEILALLLDLVRDLGLSILVITHDLGLAWNIADRVAVMYLGRIVEEGPTEEILSNPQHPYTQALLSVVSETEHVTPQVLAGEPPDPSNIPGGCRFHPRCPALASGRAAAAGIDARCRTELLAPLPAEQAHGVACFLSASRPGMLTD